MGPSLRIIALSPEVMLRLVFLMISVSKNGDFLFNRICLERIEPWVERMLLRGYVFLKEP